MRIDRLDVQNFRCFEHLSLDLHPEFNVLIGDNGSGKTAILEALAVAVGDWLRAIGGLPTRDIDTPDVRLVGRSVGDATTFEPQSPLRVTTRGRVGGLPARWTSALGTPKDQEKRTLDATLRGIAQEAARRVSAGEEVTLPLVAYYDIGRLWASPNNDEDHSPLTQSDLSRLEGYRDTLSARTGSGELRRWLEYQDRVAYQEKYKSPVYRAVLEAMRGMVEGAADVRFDVKRLEVVVEFEGNIVHPFGHLSAGQRNTLALAGDIAMRMARLNPQFDDKVLNETPGVVLIDELDLHLHPNWQRHVVEDLKRLFPKIQFITTTHSPFIIQTLGEGELLPLKGQPVLQVDNLGIETIARGLMGVERPDVSPHYREMVGAAKTYLETLEEAVKAPEAKLEDFKSRLAAQVEPYADNPAFQAFLEMERVATLGE